MPLPLHSGVLAAGLAYVMWGVFPLYIKQLGSVPVLEVVAHRSMWSFVLVFGLLAFLGRLSWLRDLVASPRTLLLFALSAALLSANWLLYVWAVNAGRVLDASLGYFINPLVNVLLGVLVLHERPRPLHWVAVGLAAAGVGWLALGTGHVPWVSLALALSFGLYGLLRKTAQLAAMEGLALETWLQAPLAIGYLVWLAAHGQGHFGPSAPGLSGWLLLAGPFTAIPLLLFAHGARQVTMATLGLMQYISPSLQFMLGLWLYHEPFDAQRGLGFLLIWTGLALYTAESWRQRRATMQAAAAART